MTVADATYSDISSASHNSKEGVEVVITDVEGNELVSFFANEKQSFYQMAQDNDVELPVSCCSGACFVCACRVTEGLELVDIGKLSVPLVDVEEDQVLSCVGGVISGILAKWGYHRIILQKLL